MQAHTHRGDHAEVAATAAQRPEQLWLVIRVGRDDSSIRQDNLGAEQVVQCKAEPPVERTVAAAECQAGHADTTDIACRGDQPVGRGCA
jgi:hypothetical protein